MTFDVTNLDRKMLLKALIAYSEPLGIGIAEYDVRKSRKENVDGLSDYECEEMLREFEQLQEGSKRILDYHKGQPIKFDLWKKKTGQIVADTAGFDSRNGKYRFLEVMMDFFLEDEIVILKKGYGEHIGFEGKNRDISNFQNIVKNAIEKRNTFGRYWILNTEHPNYINPFKRFISE